MPLNVSGSMVPGLAPSKDWKADITASSSSCSPDDLEANMFKRTVKLIGEPASATIWEKSSSDPGRPSSAKVSAICCCENLSKMQESDFVATCFFLAGMMVVF